MATFISVLKCMQPLSSAVVDWFVIPYVFPILPIYPPICIPIYPSHCFPFNPLLLLLSYSMFTHLSILQSPNHSLLPIASPHLTHLHLPLLIYLSLSHSIPSSSCLPPPHLTSLSPTPSPSLDRCPPSPPARTWVPQPCMGWVFIGYGFHVCAVCVGLLQCMTNSCSKTLYVDRVNNVEDCESCDCHVIIILYYSRC